MSYEDEIEGFIFYVNYEPTNCEDLRTALRDKRGILLNLRDLGHGVLWDTEDEYEAVFDLLAESIVKNSNQLKTLING